MCELNLYKPLLAAESQRTADGSNMDVIDEDKPLFSKVPYYRTSSDQIHDNFNMPEPFQCDDNFVEYQALSLDEQIMIEEVKDVPQVTIDIQESNIYTAGSQSSLVFTTTFPNEEYSISFRAIIQQICLNPSVDLNNKQIFLKTHVDDAYELAGTYPKDANLDLKFKLSLTNPAIYLKLRKIPSLPNATDPKPTKAHNGKRRGNESTIRKAIYKVRDWQRARREGVIQPSGITRHYDCKEAARFVCAPASTLKHYEKEIKKGRKNGFNFELYKEFDMGDLTKFNLLREACKQNA